MPDEKEKERERKNDVETPIGHMDDMDEMDEIKEILKIPISLWSNEHCLCWLHKYPIASPLVKLFERDGVDGKILSMCDDIGVLTDCGMTNKYHMIQMITKIK